MKLPYSAPTPPDITDEPPIAAHGILIFPNPLRMSVIFRPLRNTPFSATDEPLKETPRP